MTKLTDTQLIVLSQAAARRDGAAIMPERLNASAAAKVATSLITKMLMQEVASTNGMPVWRRDGEGMAFSLVVTAAGRAAIGVEDEAGDRAGEQPDIDQGNDSNQIAGSIPASDVIMEAPAEADAILESSVACTTPCSSGLGSDIGPQENCDDDQRADNVRAELPASSTPGTCADHPAHRPAVVAMRAGTKQSLIVDLLSREEGATIDALIAATGWLPHTTRAALTGLRKRGFVIERTASGEAGSIYRIIGNEMPAAASAS